MKEGYFKGLGNITVNKPVISIIDIVAHTWLLCYAQICVNGLNPPWNYSCKSVSVIAIVQQISVSFDSLRNTIVHLQITPPF